MAKRKATPNPLDSLLGGTKPELASPTPPEPETSTDPTYERTSTGYQRTTGERVRRVSFFVNDAQRRELKARVARAGYDDLSSYLIDVLKL